MSNQSSDEKYELKVNTEQLFNLTKEQKESISDFPFFALNFIKRPGMFVVKSTNDKVTERERELMNSFSIILQENLIFKWIDPPDQKYVIDVLEEINLYIKNDTIEKLNEHKAFYLRVYEKFKFENYELTIKRTEAMIEALNNWKNKKEENKK